MNKETVIRTFTRVPRLSTERLCLRFLSVHDAEDMYEYARLPEVTRYLLWNEHPDLIYTRRYLSYLETRYRTGECFDFALVHEGDGKMIGTCGYTRIDFSNHSAEIGYVLHPAYWNLGLGTEAAAAVIQFGFAYLGLHRIEARYMKNNLASRRVMEKCGMEFEGIFRGLMLIKGSYEDIGICARLSDT